MVNYDNFRASIMLALLLYSISSYSQNQNEAFPEFKKYKTWGYHFAPVIYNRATITPREGTVTIKSLPMTTMGFGFTKLIKPENKISFKTGVYIEVTPLYRFNLDLKSEDVYDGYRNITDLYGAAFYRPVITIPAFVQFKKQLANKIYFNIETGFQFVIMQPGSFLTGLTLSNQEQDETRQIFSLYGDSSETNIYPNLIISPGFYFTLDKLLIQANFIYQKSFIAYYKGEYLFDNLFVSPRSRGDYELQGDYIGLSFNVHILKKEYRSRWQRKQKEKFDFDEQLD